LKRALKASVVRSSGLLLGAAIPSAILLLGASRAIDDENAMWFALWTEVIALGVLGYVAFLRRGTPWILRLVGALTTAAFGIVLIVLKAFIH
ncbi:hypothetical protein ACC691_36995, partial [Rhizobium johnstonii]|uniref:hypothetical protein n=1 Tax=Rhizobium johnstonii TaxID=3019933 RepID=UPI003F9E8E3B